MFMKFCSPITLKTRHSISTVTCVWKSISEKTAPKKKKCFFHIGNPLCHRPLKTLTKIKEIHFELFRHCLPGTFTCEQTSKNCSQTRELDQVTPWSPNKSPILWPNIKFCQKGLEMLEEALEFCQKDVSLVIQQTFQLICYFIHVL